MVVAWNSWKATTEAACAPQKRVGESWEDTRVENISTHVHRGLWVYVRV